MAMQGIILRRSSYMRAVPPKTRRKWSRRHEKRNLESRRGGCRGSDWAGSRAGQTLPLCRAGYPRSEHGASGLEWLKSKMWEQCIHRSFSDVDVGIRSSQGNQI